MKKILVSILFLIILVGCASPEKVEVDNGRYENISVDRLKTMMDERRDSFLLINTHIPFEGNIPTTDLSIPFNEIRENLDKLPDNKDAEIVLYCRNDPMSRSAAADLVEQGYTNVKNLEGGFNAWLDAGLPLVREP